MFKNVCIILSVNLLLIKNEKHCHKNLKIEMNVKINGQQKKKL